MDLYEEVICTFAGHIRKLNIDAIAKVEIRDFWFKPAIAQQLNVTFVPIRKSAKLLGETYSYSYNLEYGSAVIEV